MTDDLSLGRNLYDCCEHCDHGVNDPPHLNRCPAAPESTPEHPRRESE